MGFVIACQSFTESWRAYAWIGIELSYDKENCMIIKHLWSLKSQTRDRQHVNITSTSTINFRPFVLGTGRSQSRPDVTTSAF